MREGLGTSLCEPGEILGFALPDHVPDGQEEWEAIALRLGRTGLHRGLLDPHVAHSKRGYTRVLLAEDACWNLLLLGWLPGQSTPIHGHGRSAGLARILSGHLLDVRFQLRNGVLSPVRARRAVPADLLVEEREAIHRVSNCGEEPALSLHLYSPPLHEVVDLSGLPVGSLDEEAIPF